MNVFESNTVIVDFPPVREPFTGLVIAVRPGIDDLQSTLYLIIRERPNGNRQFTWGYQGYLVPQSKPRIYPRHNRAFEAVWYSERFVRYTSKEA